jgi:DNA-binding CsgD family transcriptional regulator
MSSTSAERIVPERARQATTIPTGAGLILLDSSLNPIGYNTEAAQILTHPQVVAEGAGLDAVLTQKIRASLLLDHAPSGRHIFAREFKSGKRSYVCRTFELGMRASRVQRSVVALLLKRKSFGNAAVEGIAQQYRLTQREREILQQLLKGLSSKEIAAHMGISSNTVKSFLRLVMTKMGVGTRYGIFGKIVACSGD